MTVAIDVKSRAILALVLRLDAPSALTNSLALHMVSTPKDKFLSKLDVAASWPMHGIPRTLSLDNGSDFRSRALKFGCEQNLINIDHRPALHPTMGGIVERAIQTINRETHQLPGTTKGDIVTRRGYKAEDHASLTLKELERYLTLFVTGQYHQRVHKGLGISPSRAWEEGISGGDDIVPPIRTPRDPRRFLIDFLPYKDIGITRRGFNYKGVYYNDDILETIRLKDGKRKYVVRRDPRNIRLVFAYIDSLQPPRYLEIAAVDRTLPDISEEEYLAIKAKRVKEAKSFVNDDLIYEAHLEAEAMVEAARDTRMSVRKKAARRRQSKKSVAAIPTTSPDQLPSVDINKDTVETFSAEDLAGLLDDGFDSVDPN